MVVMMVVGAGGEPRSHLVAAEVGRMDMVVGGEPIRWSFSLSSVATRVLMPSCLGRGLSFFFLGGGEEFFVEGRRGWNVNSFQSWERELCKAHRCPHSLGLPGRAMAVAVFVK